MVVGNSVIFLRHFAAGRNHLYLATSSFIAQPPTLQVGIKSAFQLIVFKSDENFITSKVPITFEALYYS